MYFLNINLTNIMKTITNLGLQNFDRTSKNWDKRTKTLLVHVEGSGNMFGGGGKLIHVTLHGDNSITDTGSVTIEGVATYGHNISRGANGDNSQTVKYFKGIENFDDVNTKTPTYMIEITGSCGGGEDALRSILQAELEWLVETPEIVETA